MSDVLITTAISYTNGKPHIGHLYEIILADFIKNVFCVLDKNVKLLTGTDEHGKKIQETAKLEGISEIELCNKYSNIFQEMDNKLNIGYDHFIRTTDKIHKDLVIKSVNTSLKNKDIYEGKYVGWYDIKEECYITELNAKLTNYMNPLTNKPYERIEEETYMFQLLKYKKEILELLNNEKWIVPHKFSTEIIKRVESEEFNDLSITRTTFDWGIKFPNNEKHVLYVWFDALLNYITGNNILFPKQYTNTYHIIGKDIIWFHSVIYPAILKSIGIKNPQSILVHGFILDDKGRKMSKSLGNVIDVDWLLENYPVEAIKFYLINETILGSDISFSTHNLKESYNNILLKNFGNLFQRLFKIMKPLQNEINNWLDENISCIEIFKDNIYLFLHNFTETYDFISYKEKMNTLLDYCNKELTDKMPWKTKDINIIGSILLKFNCACAFLYPIIPDKIKSLIALLGWTSDTLKLNNFNIKLNFDNKEIKLVAFTKIE
jgi:methionyl-tRNA synthetase